MQLDRLSHLVFLRNWTNVPLSNLEIFPGCQPGFVLRHEPDFVLQDITRFDLVEKLDSPTVSNVEVEDMIRAEDSVHGVRALRTKSIQAL